MKLKLVRAQIRRSGIYAIASVDVTQKSAVGKARAFAPPWSIIMGIKRGKTTVDEYIAAYTRQLKVLPRETWVWLSNQAVGALVLLCYCRDDQFCHTHMIIDFACANYPELFEDGRRK